MNFNCITGQRDIIRKLKLSLENGKIGHAYIFSGPKGIGKKTVANVFAHLLLCGAVSDGNSCESCLPCRMLNEGTNPDFYAIMPDRNGSIGVDEIRAMQQDIIIKPLYSSRKVYMIPNADGMTVQAQNCLLKTLEEPPSYAVIILTAENYYALAETIRSRSIRYDFKMNTPEEVHEVLERLYGKQLKEADFIISYSNGVIGRAIELAESKDFLLLREQTLEMLLSLHKPGSAGIFSAFDYFDLNRDKVDDILDIMIMFYRDMLVAKENSRENTLINSDKKDIILFNAHNFTTDRLIENIETIDQTRNQIKKNANYQLAIEVMLMKLHQF